MVLMFPSFSVDKAEQKILKDFRERKVAFQEDGAVVYETTLGNLGYDLNEAALKSTAYRTSEDTRSQSQTVCDTGRSEDSL